jgi:hypothetical protein
MTPNQVKLKMPISPGPDAGSYTGTSVMAAGLEFSVTLFFDNKQGLNTILLRYARRSDPDVGTQKMPTEPTFHRAVEVVKELATKYGTAVHETGGCGDEAAFSGGIPSCEVAFKGNAQSIKLTYIGDGNGRLIYVAIAYQPVANSL